MIISIFKNISGVFKKSNFVQNEEIKEKSKKELNNK